MKAVLIIVHTIAILFVMVCTSTAQILKDVSWQ